MIEPLSRIESTFIDDVSGEGTSEGINKKIKTGVIPGNWCVSADFYISCGYITMLRQLWKSNRINISVCSENDKTSREFTIEKQLTDVIFNISKTSPADCNSKMTACAFGIAVLRYCQGYYDSFHES